MPFFSASEWTSQSRNITCGPTGPTGPSGGPVGPTGPPGTNGTNGTNGNDGDTGATGSTGPEGPQGPQGPVGPNGNNGNNGINGLPGDVGQQGPTGPQGTPGTPGAGYDTSKYEVYRFNGSLLGPDYLELFLQTPSTIGTQINYNSNGPNTGWQPNSSGLYSITIYATSAAVFADVIAMGISKNYSISGTEYIYLPAIETIQAVSNIKLTFVDYITTSDAIFIKTLSFVGSTLTLDIRIQQIFLIP